MKTLKWTDPSSAENVLQQAQEENVLVMRNGQPVAVVMALSDDDAQWLEREADPAFIESIAKGRLDAREGQLISHEDLKKKLGL
jgi:hypothetical protein